MAGANKIVVTINGVRYPIRSVEDPTYVKGLAEELDQTITNLMGQASLSLNEAMVLISLEYLDCYKKAERNLDNMRDQLTTYMEEADRMRGEAEEARRELQRLRGKQPATSASK